MSEGKTDLMASPQSSFTPIKATVASLLIAALVLVLDQVSKVWIVETVMNPPKVIEITGFFNLVMGWNKGVSFGMLSSWDSHAKAMALVALAIAVSLALMIWVYREARLWVVLPCGMIAGGAIGNALDRLSWGAVADFLDFHAFGIHWPAFNVADMGISIGAAILIADSLFNGADSTK